MPLTGPSAIGSELLSLKCGCVKEHSPSFMSLRECQLGKKPAGCGFGLLAFTDKDHRRPSVCGSKVPGLFEVLCVIPPPPPTPGVCQKSTYTSFRGPIHFLALGPNVFCVQSFSDFWFGSNHLIEFPHPLRLPFSASLYPLLIFWLLMG